MADLTQSLTREITGPLAFRLDARRTHGTGGVSIFAFTFNGAPFTFGGAAFTHGAV